MEKENKEAFEFVNKAIEKYPRVATLVVTTTVISLAAAGFAFGKVRKPEISFGLKAESVRDQNKITIQELNDCYLVKFHNEVTNTDNYKFAVERDNAVYNALDNKKLFELSDSEKGIIAYSKLGSIDEYLLTYDMMDTVFKKEDLEKLINTISNDINEKEKKLVK